MRTRSFSALHCPALSRPPRGVEVPERFGPLVDALADDLELELVDAGGQLLGPRADHWTTYVCASLPERRLAMVVMTFLIVLALHDDDLRDCLTDVGHPQMTDLGYRVLLWFPKLCGNLHTVH
jgi:hypothetical protein